TRTAPDGTEWTLRVLVAQGAPEITARPTVSMLARNGMEWIAPPRLSDQQETNATVTALAAFAKCPREYYLSQYLGLEGRLRKLEENGTLAAGECGTMVHALLAGKAVVNPDPKAIVMAEVFRQSPLGGRAARASRLEREFDFVMEANGLVLRGQ